LASKVAFAIGVVVEAVSDGAGGGGGCGAGGGSAAERGGDGGGGAAQEAWARAARYGSRKPAGRIGEG